MVTPILLVIGCLAFLILEVFLVSFGTIAIVAISMGVGGVLLAFQESSVFGWTLLATMVAGGPLCIWSAFKLLPKLPFARGLYLRGPKLTDAARRAAAAPLTELLGAEGKASTPLRPAGTAVFDGRPVAVVTTGSMVATGAAIRVVDVTGNRVVVEEVERA